MDPALRKRLLSTLKDEITTLSPQQRSAAKYIVDNPSDFGLDSVRTTASKAGVSTYTLVSLSKKLGFNGFEDFRHPFRHALLTRAHGPDLPNWPDAHKASAPVFSEAVANATAIVGRTLVRQNPDELDQVAALLSGSRHVYLTGMRSTYAIAYYLHYVGRMALPALELIPRHRNSAIDDLNSAGPADALIAITITPYSRETIEACEFAQKKGVKLVIVSDSEVVVPHLSPIHNLVASVESTHQFGCFAGMMALIDLLIALLLENGGATARERIKSYERLRIENNAYWVAQKKH